MKNHLSLKYVAFGNSYDDLIPYEYHHKTVKDLTYKIADAISDSIWSVHENDIKVDQVSFSIDVDTIDIEITFTREFDDAEFEIAAQAPEIVSFVLLATADDDECEVEFTLDSFTK